MLFQETKLERCEQWLLALLSDGAVKPGDVVEIGKQTGFSRTTIYSARLELGDRIANTDGYLSPFNMWKLAE